jgi:rare lipoprotein A
MIRSRANASWVALLIAFDLFAAAGGIVFQMKHGAPLASFARGAEGYVVALGPRPATAALPLSQAPARLVGMASWYGRHWQGRKTASGKRYDDRRLTAAHPTLPLDTRVRVTNTTNGKSVTVLINDRGPYVDGRVIDLSTAAARHLGMVKVGVVPVRIEIVGEPHAPPIPPAKPPEESTARQVAGLPSSARAAQAE